MEVLDEGITMAPPHSLEAEQSVLGAVLLSNESFDSVSWLPESAFYFDKHRRLWAAMRRGIEAGRPVDILTICEELGSDLEKGGGPAYIAGLAQNTPGTANVRRYAELVRDKALLRELAQRSIQITQDALAGLVPPAEQVEAAEALIYGLTHSQAREAQSVHVGQAATEYVEWADNHPDGIATGLADFDGLTGGLLPGNLVIVAGRPHMGKTALALQFAEHICESQPGLIFSLESTRREVAGRLVEWHKSRLGRDGAVDKVFKLNMFIDDTGTITPGLMRARIRRHKRQHGLSLVVVDYLQLVRGKGDSREQEVAFISRELKAIAKEFEIPVVALAQLNRKVEERTDKRPHMADLRESGAIEQDADLVALLYRPDYYDTEFSGTLAEAEIHVPKNRNNGRSGLVKVMFDRRLGRFGDFIPERFRPSLDAA